MKRYITAVLLCVSGLGVSCGGGDDGGGTTAPPPQASPCATIVDISPESSTNGSLTTSDCIVEALFPGSGDHTFVDQYRVTLPSSGRLTIRMNSETFDSFLLLSKSPLQSPPITADDDGGGGINARISSVLDAGTYVILAGSARLLQPETGNYTLTTAFTHDSLAYVANEGSNSLTAFTINQASFNINQGAGNLNAIPGSPFPTGTRPTGVVVSPDGTFAYVVNQGSGTVSAFAIDHSTGALSPVTGSPYSVGTNPVGIAISPTGTFLYVTNSGSNTVSAFLVDPNTGGLTPTIGSPFSTVLSNPSGIAVSPDSSWLYVVEGSNSLAIFHIFNRGELAGAPGSLGLSTFVPVGSTPTDVAVYPNGAFVYVTNQGSNSISAFSVKNPTTGELGLIAGSPFPTGVAPAGLVIAPNGFHLYVANQTDNNISAYSISPTGALTPVQGSPFAAGSTPTAVTVSPEGAFLYVTNQGSNNVFGYAINGSSGALLPLGGSPFPVGVMPRSIATPGHP